MKLGTAVLVEELRREDEEQKPLLFHAALSGSKATLLAAHRLLRRTLGSGGVDHQFRHVDAKGSNVLMHAAGAGEDGTWSEVWKVLDKNGWLHDQLHATDGEGRGVFHYAAAAGNVPLVQRVIALDQGLEHATDRHGWTTLMHAARGGRGIKVIEVLLELYRREPLSLEMELAKVGTDGTNLLMHAALGGKQTFSMLRKAIYPGDGVARIRHPDDPVERVRTEAKLLARAAEGGSVNVLGKIAEGIKVGTDSIGLRSNHPVSTSPIICVLQLHPSGSTTTPSRQLDVGVRRLCHILSLLTILRCY